MEIDHGVWPDERAGWWRRTIAVVLDSLCVIVPSAVLGAFLFAMTGGFLQWAGPGLQWQTCAPVASISKNLDPPPPPNSNHAALCQDYSVAGQIGRTLSVGRITRDQGAVTDLSRSYLLDASGQAAGHDLSWMTWIALLALFVGCEWRSGTTPGKRLLGIRVVAVQDPERRSLPLKQVATRYGVAIAGVLLPTGAALCIVLLPVVWGGTPSGVAWLVFTLMLTLSAAWQIWNLVRIVKRRPTVYDAMAGVEVIRVRQPARGGLAPPTTPALA